GTREERVLRLGHDKLSTYGIGHARTKEEWQHLAHQLRQAGYVRPEGEYIVLKLTERGRTALFKREPIMLPPPPQARSSVRTATPELASLPASHWPLFEHLRALRKRLADERGVPPYVVFHDRVLQQ